MLKSLACVLLLAGLVLAPAAYAANAIVTGTATFRERIALPPGAKFEAAILDVSRADAPAEVLARTAIDNPGQPPIAFALTFDDSQVNPKARYVLRATISVDGKLWFTTDTTTPVLGRGGSGRVELLLRRVAPPQALLDAPPAAGKGGLLGGAFRYFADAATFELCRTDEQIPVAMEVGYLDLEAAYREKRSEPGTPLYVTVEGMIEPRAGMEGEPRPNSRRQAIYRRLARGDLRAQPRDSSLANAPWKIAVLKGETLAPVEGRREAALIFRSSPPGQVSATVGCNQMAGSYEATEDGKLTFGRFASTMMACPPPLDARERALSDVLGATRAYAIAGPTLVLYDDLREPLAVLQSVALR